MNASNRYAPLPAAAHIRRASPADGWLVALVSLFFLTGLCAMSGKAQAATQEVWLADVGLTLQASDNPVTNRIYHSVTITNHGDDSGRDILFTLIPVYATQVVTSGSQNSVCQTVTVVWQQVVRCTLPLLNVSQTETIKITTTRNTTFPGRKIATAQAMGVSPDWDGANNTDTAEFFY